MVKWVAQLSRDNDDTIANSVQLKFHLCTDEDYDSFYEPGDDYKVAFQRLKKQKTLFCLDDDQIVEIYGGSYVSHN
jgi:hypothetical protein